MEIVKVGKEEGWAATLSFIYYFCVLAAYYVIRPVRDQLAVEAGSGELLRFFTVTFFAMLILSPLFSRLMSVWPRQAAIPLVYLLCIGCQLLFVPLLTHPEWLDAKTVGLLFFVWESVFNLFAVSVFWSFMSDIWDDHQARRLYPFIALGGAAGAVAGPFITRSSVGWLGSPPLLCISALFLLTAIVCVFLLGKWAVKYSTQQAEDSGKALGGSMFEGLKQIFSDPFIGSISVMMLLNDAIGTIAYVLITDYSGHAFPHNAVAQTQFAATMDLAANTLQICLQLSLTRWLLVRFGAAGVFAVWTVVVAAACLSLAFVKNPYTPLIGTLPLIALVLILGRALAYGMLQPARETLYTLVSRGQRYKGKNAVDTAVWRAGDVLSLLFVDGLKGIGTGIAGFGLIWTAFATLSGWIGWRLAKRIEP